MILFFFNDYEKTAQSLNEIPEITFGKFSLIRFPSEEMYIFIGTPVDGYHCVILGSISPPDEQLLATTLLADTLKKEGAHEVIAVLPYLAYGRQDKQEFGESLTIAWIGKIFQASGIDQVITVDLHSLEDQKLFPIPLTSLSPAKVFAQELANLDLLDVTLVAPDEGAIHRCQEVALAADIKTSIAYFEKVRLPEDITHYSLQGSVGSKVVLIDDILDTGKTLISACKHLKKIGVSEIIIMVTHGLFTGSSWQQLIDLGVEKIYCTDTVPFVQRKDLKGIKQLSVNSLIKEEIEKLVS